MSITSAHLNNPRREGAGLSDSTVGVCGGCEGAERDGWGAEDAGSPDGHADWSKPAVTSLFLR
jgi:hypothetical protein